MAGNGTIGLEILEDLPDADAIVIPWGVVVWHAESRQRSVSLSRPLKSSQPRWTCRAVDGLLECRLAADD